MMRAGERARVMQLSRPTDEDRSRWEGQDGLLIRRLNVPWTPDHGALWELRFDSGDVVVFADNELALLRGGEPEPNDMAALRSSWGDAPRSPSLPFRRLGAGNAAATAILALLVFSLAGVLLVWAGIAESNMLYSAAGGLLALIGIVTAGVLIR